MNRRARAIERRDVKTESPSVTDEGKIRGLAIPFDSFTLIGSGPLSFREKVASGSVTKTLRESDLVYLDNHDPAKPVARKSAGTLEVKVSDRGVEYLAEPADTTYAHDLVANIRAGNIQGNSFGFEVVKDKWEIGDDGVDERTLLEIKLPELSACTFPAYPQTDIGMRDAYAIAMEARDMYYEGRAGDAPGNGKKPYGNVKYADPGYQKDGKKRYPLDTSKHVHAAWAYISKAKNAGFYTAQQLAHIKAAIKAAAKKIGMAISSDEKNSAFYEELDLRNYDPTTGFADEVETRDDPDGHETAAMEEALEHLRSGDADAAQSVLEDCLSSQDDEDDDDTEDSNGMVAHTEEGGASVPVRSEDAVVSAATLLRVTSILQELPETAQSREAVKILEGVAVAVEPRTLERAYDLVRSLTPTAQSNEALSTLEPLIGAAESTAAEGERSTPKPEVSTSVIARESDMGRELAKRFEALQHGYRP